jgi:single-strand DNA-binding protein
MNSLNSILIEGNLTGDPVTKETPRGSLVCTFSIAVNRYYKQENEMQQETSYIEVESWARLAEACQKTCGKGRGVRVVGRAKQDRWTDSEGRPQSKIKIVAEHIEFKPAFRNKSDGGSECDPV